jgi:hypothetical protein
MKCFAPRDCRLVGEGCRSNSFEGLPLAPAPGAAFEALFRFLIDINDALGSGSTNLTERYESFCPYSLAPLFNAKPESDRCQHSRHHSENGVSPGPSSRRLLFLFEPLWIKVLYRNANQVRR